jgi:hypothetical protein
MSDLYDTDFVRWAEQQADLLHRRAANQLDWNNVAEEIEGLAANNRNDMRSRIRTILDHLLRLDASPALDPRHGWQRTLLVQRQALQDLLELSPSLRREVARVVAAELPRARELAALSLAEHGETPRVPLDQLAYTEVDVLGPPLPPE